MSSIPLQDDTRAYTEAVAALRLLSAEVNAGFEALSQNDLQQFEARVAAQEKLCESLRSTGMFNADKLRVLVAELKKASASVRKAHDEKEQTYEFFELQTELSRLNRVYTNLVGRGQELVSILIELQKGLRKEYSRQGKPLSPDHTWSCEV
jgi:hypothetical protein